MMSNEYVIPINYSVEELAEVISEQLTFEERKLLITILFEQIDKQNESRRTD